MHGNLPLAYAGSLGLEAGVVRLVAYDAAWPWLFEAEARRIRDACAPLQMHLEHVGGTSVPGMCAKPILDIAAAAMPGTPMADYVAALSRAGYEYRGERGVPGRQYFRRGEPRAFHLHLVEIDGERWKEYLAFRDYLRSHPEAAKHLADVKCELAARYPRDREGYTDAKTPYILAILKLASGSG